MARIAVVDIDLSEVRSVLSLHHMLRDALGFPSWYGCNWGAFWDAITGLVKMPLYLRISGWGVVVTRLPNDAQIIQKCLADMAEAYPELSLQVELA
jgi:ribonuclease inhibitor